MHKPHVNIFDVCNELARWGFGTASGADIASQPSSLLHASTTTN
jgi:hypothetical protein